MRNGAREVVVTGAGVCCHMGDDWPAIEGALREGRPRPFTRWPPAAEHRTQCEIIGLYPGDLSPARLGIDKGQARFMGRAARLALRAARLERCLELRDIAQLQIPVIDWRVSQPLYPLVRSALNRSFLRRDANLRREETGQ